MVAQEAVTKRHSVGTRGGSLLQAFGKFLDADLGNAATFQSTQRSVFHGLL
jgi:hypothetical protein